MRNCSGHHDCTRKRKWRALAAVEDPTNALHRILPEADARTYRHLNCIDWHGDTVFNHIQAPQLLAEWVTLEFDKSDHEAKRVIEGVQELIHRLMDQHHVYLKFYGD